MLNQEVEQCQKAKVQGFEATTQLLTDKVIGVAATLTFQLGPVDHGIWSHYIFRRCTARLPTSLGCIASVDKRLSIEETGCGYAVRRPESFKGLIGPQAVHWSC